MARRNRQPRIFTHNRKYYDLRVEREVFNETTNDQRLLRILLTKEREVSSKSVQQDRHHRRHTTKMTGTRSAFELLRQTFNIHVSRKTFRIDLFNRRREDVVDVVVSQQ